MKNVGCIGKLFTDTMSFVDGHIFQVEYAGEAVKRGASGVSCTLTITLYDPQ